MAKRFGLVLLFLSTVMITVAYASAFLPAGAPGWAPWFLAVGTATMLVAMMTLGAARHGRIGKLVYPFAFVFVVVAGGFGLALALPPADPVDPTLWLGLPPRAAVILYGIGLLPLLAVPVAYALTFDEMTLSQEDLERIRAAARAARPASAAEVTPVPAGRPGERA